MITVVCLFLARGDRNRSIFDFVVLISKSFFTFTAAFGGMSEQRKEGQAVHKFRVLQLN